MASADINSAQQRSGWSSLLDLTPYHWFVFIICCLAWDLDCMDQQLFVLARVPAVTELYGKPEGMDANKIADNVKLYGTYSTSAFLIGWAIGGLGFGVMGDRRGRVKTLMTTILIYSVFTGLSSFSVGIYDFMFYRFLTGCCVLGVFAGGGGGGRVWCWSFTSSRNRGGGFASLCPWIASSLKRFWKLCGSINFDLSGKSATSQSFRRVGLPRF